MKRALASLLLTACLVNGGCLTFGDKGTPEIAPAAATPPPPVTAERISRQNAREMSQALWDEMDRDILGSSAAPVTPVSSKKR